MDNLKAGQLVARNKEKEEIAILELFIGENIIGRVSGEESEEGGLSALSADNFLSRKHFIIDIERDRYDRIRFFLKDNHSSNGTWLKNKKNGTVRKLETKDALELSAGDMILGGETYFTLEISALPDTPREAQRTRIIT